MATKRPITWLLENIGKTNIMDKFDEQELVSIGRRVISGYDTDEQSRSEWKKKTEDGLKVAKQITEKKTFPWKDAANVKFPLIANASIQFAARAYPQIIQGRDIVRASVVGDDPEGLKELRAKRISQHMSWQLLDQMEEWEPGMDQLLHGLPVMGTYFKKSYFDPLYKRNKSDALTPFEVVVNMKHKGTIETCRRISQQIYLYKNEVIEREAAEIFVDGFSDCMTVYGNADENAPQELFIEQHCWYDADGDGYEEPYIVTTHYDSGKVGRITANYNHKTIDLRGKDFDKIVKITPVQYFTCFIFLPDPEGDFYGIGFAHLLGPINEAMSSLINQLLDAGALSNTGGGFISKGLRWNGGAMQFELGEWKPVDTIGMSLKDAILPLPVREPSSTLFQLLGLLNETGQKLASVSDAMSGEMPSQGTTATTTLAMIEQGLKVFTGIYKRVFRSLKSEFKKLYALNSQYLNQEEYFRVMDSQLAVFRTDYSMDDLDVIPVADPTMASEAQRLARAQALLNTIEINPDPMGKAEILLQYYDAIGAKNIPKLLDVEQLSKQLNTPPPPNPDLLKIELETQKASDAQEVRLSELEETAILNMAKLEQIEVQTDLLKAQILKTVAETEAIVPGGKLDELKYQASAIDQERMLSLERDKMTHEKEIQAKQHEHDQKMAAVEKPASPPTPGKKVTLNRGPDGELIGADINEVSPSPVNPGEGSISENSEDVHPLTALAGMKKETMG